MKLKTDTSVQTTIAAEKHTYKVSAKNIARLMEMSTLKQYSKPYLATIVEIVSNAADSGTLKDIIVRLTENVCEVVDFGKGISPEAWDKYYVTLFASDKDVDNTKIGGFGLGCKAPMSVSDIFFVTTYWENKLYRYSCYKDNGEYCHSLLSTEDAVGEGTTVTIPLSGDMYDQFLEAIQEGLRYFPNLYFDITGVDNNYKIIKGKHFVTRINDSSCAVFSHRNRPRNGIVMGGVYYNIPQNNLCTNLNIPLLAEIGEYDPVLSRDGIQLNTESLQRLNELVDRAGKELDELHKATPPIGFGDWLQGKYEDNRIQIVEDVWIPDPYRYRSMSRRIQVGDTILTDYQVNSSLNDIAVRDSSRDKFVYYRHYDLKRVFNAKPDKYYFPEGSRQRPKINAHLKELHPQGYQLISAEKCTNKAIKEWFKANLPHYFEVIPSPEVKIPKAPAKPKQADTVYVREVKYGWARDGEWVDLDWFGELDKPVVRIEFDEVPIVRALPQKIANKYSFYVLSDKSFGLISQVCENITLKELYVKHFTRIWSHIHLQALRVRYRKDIKFLKKHYSCFLFPSSGSNVNWEDMDSLETSMLSCLKVKSPYIVHEGKVYTKDSIKKQLNGYINSLPMYSHLVSLEHYESSRIFEGYFELLDGNGYEFKINSIGDI